MPEINFTVDAALLRELGERLVGRPHIALAELIKNSYDADATAVLIGFEEDRLTVIDDGHGMDATEFRDYWMRIGSPHKERLQRSRLFGRPLTGSKGIGRLSAQFLAKQLRLTTASDGSELLARVDWTKAVTAGDLTRASAVYEQRQLTTTFPNNSRRGTALELWELNQQWDPDAFRRLAREIWQLQPPFRSANPVTDFQVELRTGNTSINEQFVNQMQAFLKIWHGRIVGHLSDGDDSIPGSKRLLVSLEFDDGTRQTVTHTRENCHLDRLDYEIRIFSLHNRQPAGIRVDDLRRYLKDFGGVHVYDAGFHLPYYGVNTDWLRIELDHSHRLSRSELLPDMLQVEDGLNFLPTNTRIYGVVRVNTGEERAATRTGANHLMIQASRDRLVDNGAFQDLRDLVRFGLDYYATREAVRNLRAAEARAPREPARPRLERVEAVLDRHEASVPAPVMRTIKSEVKAALTAVESQEEIIGRQISLLAPLATAGIAAVAYEHETARQLHQLEAIARRLQDISASSVSRDELDRLSRDIRNWISRAKALRGLFDPVMDEENRTRVGRYLAKSVVDDVIRQLEPVARGTTFELRGIDPELRLPPGTYAEWTAVLQNIVINALNAMIDRPIRSVELRSTRERRRLALIVEDNGSGVSLADSEALFEPFERRQRISEERRSLGLGGTGLGLTIVRMIATSRGAEVHFTAPRAGYRTAVELSWTADA